MNNDLDLGQHFMIDEVLLNKIVESSDLTSEETVLEIGSGKGALTKYLLKKTKRLICVETDSRLDSPSEKVIFYNDNILKIIESLKFDVVIANLPYHISDPVFKKFLIKKPKKIIVVVGKKFANKLLEDSIIGIIVRELYDVEILKDIDPISFSPQPKIMSSLVRLIKKDSEGLLTTFFVQSDKKVKNYILKLFENKLTKKDIKKLLELENFSFENKKLYELSTNEFLDLYHFVKQISSAN
jgi:16S rRNA A1518/A1519 N6-dimethyltransferase RsmA/KsgA/DIM1 with predicted DNA glycosylase/AP lyase activity